MKKKTTTYSDKGYPLQVGRTYKVQEVGYWLKDYYETVSLVKLNRYGQAHLLVSTNSHLVGFQTVVVQSDSLTWVEA